MDREQVLFKYRQYAFSEYIRSLQELNLEEQIHFTDTMIKLCRLAYFNEPESKEIDELIENELLIKYRAKMRYFALNEVWECFKFENNAFPKFILKLHLPPDMPPPNEEEHGDHIFALHYAFEQLKIKLYVEDPDGNGLAKKDNSENAFSENPALTKKFKSYTTRGQQVLLLYYLNIALNVKARYEIPLTQIAKFYNGLFGWEYEDINNSTLYKHFKNDPLSRTNKKELYEQLHWVKDQFLLIGLTDIVSKIDEKIKEVERNIR